MPALRHEPRRVRRIHPRAGPARSLGTDAPERRPRRRGRRVLLFRRRLRQAARSAHPPDLSRRPLRPPGLDPRNRES